MRLPVFFVCHVSLSILLSSCTVSNVAKTLHFQYQVLIPGQTSIDSLANYLGTSSDTFITYACGQSSGHTTYWLPFKKYGLAFYSKYYNPELKNYKNGLIRAIKIFDTTGISIRGSRQESNYYSEEYLPITINNLHEIFGKPDIEKFENQVIYLLYNSKGLAFSFDNKSGQFTQLFIIKPKNRHNGA